MLIKNAMVYTEEGNFQQKDIAIHGERFSDSKKMEDEVILDAKGCYAIPGLTDLHFHGAMGRDFCDGSREAIQILADYEAKAGITTMVPATMSYDEERLSRIAAEAGKYESKQGAILCGIRMEGPFLCQKKKGAQNGEYLCKADVEMFDRLQKKAGGLFRIVDLAPEEEGALEFIQRKKEEIILSFAHSDADYEQTKRGIEAGITQMTHLYNGMNGIGHRAPGPILAAWEAKECMVELICDGVHIHPAVVRATLELFGEDRVIFISDTMEAAGLSDGCYQLGGQAVIVKGKRATLEDGTIAGSNTNLMDCVRNAVKEMGVRLETAIKCAAVNPIKALGLYQEYGSITKGKAANLVLLDQKDLKIQNVIIKGKVY